MTEVDASFLIELEISVPVDIDMNEFHEWIGDDQIELTPELAREFVASGLDWSREVHAEIEKKASTSSQSRLLPRSTAGVPQ